MIYYMKKSLYFLLLLVCVSLSFLKIKEGAQPRKKPPPEKFTFEDITIFNTDGGLAIEKAKKIVDKAVADPSKAIRIRDFLRMVYPKFNLNGMKVQLDRATDKANKYEKQLKVAQEAAAIQAAAIQARAGKPTLKLEPVVLIPAGPPNPPKIEKPSPLPNDVREAESETNYIMKKIVKMRDEIKTINDAAKKTKAKSAKINLLANESQHIASTLDIYITKVNTYKNSMNSREIKRNYDDIIKLKTEIDKLNKNTIMLAK